MEDCKGILGLLLRHKFKLHIVDHIYNGEEGRLGFAERTRSKVVCKRCGLEK